MKRSAELIVAELIDLAEKISFVVGSIEFDAFAADLKTNEATTSLLIKFGEAARLLMDEYPNIAEQNPQLPLRNAREMRNRLIHGYWSIDLRIVYDVAVRDIPASTSKFRLLRDSLKPIV